MTDKPITEDPKALAEYLVAKAMEADGRVPGGYSDDVWVDSLRERMNNAAQTITAEVEALRDDSLMWKEEVPRG